MLLKKGFSFIELLLAVVLLGVIIVTILGVFVHGLHAIKKSRYRVIAVNIANKKCSELRYLFLNNGDPISEDTIKNNIYGTDNVDNDFIWDSGNVEIRGKETADHIPYNFIINIAQEGSNDTKGVILLLKKVDIEVNWKEVEGTRHVKMSTYLSRPPVL